MIISVKDFYLPMQGENECWQLLAKLLRDFLREY